MIVIPRVICVKGGDCKVPHLHRPRTYHRFHPDDLGKGYVPIWKAWMERHGVNPDRVPIDGWIVRNVEECQVVYLEYWNHPLDELGEDWVPHPADDHHSVAFRAKVVQLDREPEPFPDTPSNEHWQTKSCLDGKHLECSLHCPFDGEQCHCDCHWQPWDDDMMNGNIKYV